MKTKNINVEVPEELEMALKRNKTAWVSFNALPPSHKKEYIIYILEAKKPETQMNRIAKTIEMLNKPKKRK